MSGLWTVLLGLALLALVASCVWQAVVSARTPQGAIAWAIFLVAAPWIAVPAYLVLGQHKLRSKTTSYRQTVAATNQRGMPAGPQEPHIVSSERLFVFSRLGGMPAQAGNSADLLINGDATFAAIFAAIDGAETYVLAQFYTIADDALGNAFADRLIAAADRGVKVWLVCDRVGSHGLSTAYRHRLIKAGVQFRDPRAGSHRASRLHVNFRNHRKTVVVDGQWAAVGGHNVADAYVGRDPVMGYWRDTHLALQGPVVSQLQTGFIRDWHWYTGDFIEDQLDWSPSPFAPGIPAVTVFMGPTDDHDTGALFFVAAITGAQRRVWVASPYFVPDVDTLSALKCAALKGCDVRILLPARADHFLPWLAAFAFFDEVRHAGVKIYRYKDGFMHQKAMLIDDDLSAVGTANFDNRSFRLNFETMVVVHDRDFADRMRDMLHTDMTHSDRLDRNLDSQHIGIRVGARLTRLLAPLL
ncbi:cardiolipin synthase [Pseudotabrizicola alkalilacus]|uniref:Cardiolipin synthase n=1 Tax=Pseudotabrizicola alkalilacus TaxID=2305252 RepID=A0A411Z087_9RHOB|nr:cardiolipin synthase [Pseudotabrizicola alkalilacus]RGP36462.1 cardiolipin synthase [Pseudotabrizicola alkalilacus]